MKHNCVQNNLAQWGSLSYLDMFEFLRKHCAYYHKMAVRQMTKYYTVPKCQKILNWWILNVDFSSFYQLFSLLRKYLFHISEDKAIHLLLNFHNLILQVRKFSQIAFFLSDKENILKPHGQHMVWFRFSLFLCLRIISSKQGLALFLYNSPHPYIQTCN